MFEKIANDLLSSEEVKSLQFEIFPKIHKDGNPGRQFNRLPYCKDFKIHWSLTTTACKRTQFVCKRLHRFHTENQQYGENYWQEYLCNHGYTFSMHKYFKQGRNWSCWNNGEKKKYRNENYIDISPLVLNIKGCLRCKTIFLS